MAPPPTATHQWWAGWLYDALKARMTPGYVALPGVGVYVTPTRFLIPDLTAVRLREGSIPQDSRGCVSPDDVPLVVEVVSPSSRAMDRTTKPTLYAHCGIPAYWRVEQAPSRTTVHVHALAGGAYKKIHEIRAGQSVTVDQPWPTTVEPPIGTP